MKEEVGFLNPTSSLNTRFSLSGKYSKL